jgi:hypothetical protein
VAQGFEQALGVQLPDVDLIARLTLAYLHEAAVRAQVDPRGVEHERFWSANRASAYRPIFSAQGRSPVL